MPITRSQIRRQLRRQGGIMDVTPGTIGGGNYTGIPMGSRTGFGLLKKIGRRVRKIIPNEVADIAVKAAPFVAPFNPAAAAAMAGIGSFDQTGSIGDSLKSAALTYGGGQLSRYVGGAGFQGNPFEAGGAFRGGLEGFKGGFSSPVGTKTGLGKIFGGSGKNVEGVKGVDDMSKYNELGLGGSGGASNIQGGIPTAIEGSEVAYTGNVFEPSKFTNMVENQALEKVNIINPKEIIKSDPNIFNLVKQGDYGEALVEGAKKFGKAVFTNKDGSLDKTALLAAGSFGLTYLDAKRLANEAGEDITIDEYDEALKAEKKEEYDGYLQNFFGGKAQGGRIGFDEGTNTKFTMIKDMLTRGVDEETIMTIANATQEDIDSVKNEGVGKAQGGRIGFADGTDKGILEKIAGVFFDEEGNARSALQRAKFELSEFIAGKGTDLRTGAEWYNKLNPEEQKEIIMEKIKYRDRGELGGVPLYDEKFAGKFGIGGNYAQGGRIGFKFGDKAEDSEGIMSMPEDKEDENMKMAGITFSKAERAYLFKKLGSSGTSGKSKSMPNLYYILNDPGSYPADAKVLKEIAIMGMGKKEGGRIGFENGANKEIAIKNAMAELKTKFPELSDENLFNLVMNGFGGMSKEKELPTPNITLEEAEKRNPAMFVDTTTSNPIPENAPNMAAAEIAKVIVGTSGDDKDMTSRKFIFEEYVMPKRQDLMENFGLDLKEADDLIRDEMNKYRKPKMAMGGEIPVRKNQGGVMELDYRENGGFVPVGIKEKADDVPAMLSKNEFVLTADAVRGVGNGSVDKGAEKLYNFMKQAEKVGQA